MREERRDIVLRLGHVSWAPTLGHYYIDMRPAIVHYTDNIYGSSFDDQGVPRVLGPNGPTYFPINIAQYCFMLHADWMERRATKTLNSLEACLAALERTKSEDDQVCVWWHRDPDGRYGIAPPWASGMAQGEAMSVYLRMYQVTGRSHLLDTAAKAYAFIRAEAGSAGIRRRDGDGNLWFEEYPSTPPSYVLNGFIYAVFGILDLYRVTGDPSAKRDFDECIQTLRRRLHLFDAGYWSFYDLQKRELVRYYYQQNVHVPQLEVLHALTGEPIFKRYADRWRRQLTPLNFLRVRVMYRVRPRLARVRGLYRRRA